MVSARLRRLDALFNERSKKGPAPRSREQFNADFWERVDRSDPLGCWSWTGKTDWAGYGILYVKQERLRAHVVAAELCDVDLGSDKPLVCHRCNNKPCCNPLHLYRGNESDNFRDCLNARRHPKQKLTYSQVLAIRRAKASGMLRTKDLARRFMVSRSTIQRTARGASYDWI